MSRILIVEDEPRIVAFLTKGLKAAGFTTHTTAEGGQAVALAVQEDFDLIILDVGLPEIDGFEGLQQLRERTVVLVDDWSDSGWTLTTAAFLLREAGAVAVHPFVLAQR